MQNKGKGLVRLRVNANQMDEKLLAIDALYSYAHSLGAKFYPAVPRLAATATPLLGYRFSDKARAAAACALSEGYRCVVLAAKAGAAPASAPADFVASMFKPLSEALGKEDSLSASDGMLDALHDMIVLERTHAAGALGAAAISPLVQLLKRQLQKDEQRLARRAAEDEPADDDDEDDEAEDVLASVVRIVRELLVQHGAACLAAVEAQLLPHIQPWAAGTDAPRLALALETIGAAIEAGGAAAAKRYVPAVLPLLTSAIGSEDATLRQAGAYGLGAVAEHGGKLLNRNAAAELANKLAAELAHPAARFSSRVHASEAVAAALGRFLVHRAAATDAAVLPTWLSWLPLRHDEDEAKAALTCLCKLLEADAAAVFGADGARFPAVLGAMAAAYEAEATGEDTSARMASLVKAWAAADAGMLQRGVAALPQPHLQEKASRMATA